MEVTVAKTAGFCFGVKRAVDAVYEQVEKHTGEPIYTFGPIIHNEEVVRDLKSRGVQVLESREQLEALTGGIVIIRSHGVEKQVYDILKERNVTCVDATCPFVKKIHKIVEKESGEGRRIVIVGDKNHPEVQGIMGWCHTPAEVIATEEEAKNLIFPPDTKICVVSQTTFNYNKFKYLVEIFSEKSYDISVLNTICSATKERQEEACHIAAQSDAMIVIGDRHSSNTQKLFEICQKACNNTYYIQTLDDLNGHQLQSVKKVGITAGASTPKNIIEEVQNNVGINF